MSLHSFLIAIAPLVGLLICLLLGWFPGERAIERLCAATRSIVNSRSSMKKPGTHQGFGVIASGGRLIALSLAGRGPPLTPHHQVWN